MCKISNTKRNCSKGNLKETKRKEKQHLDVQEISHQQEVKEITTKVC